MKAARAKIVATALLAIVSLSLAGCGEEIVPREKGVYRGAADQPLDEADRKRLHERSRLQDYN